MRRRMGRNNTRLHRMIRSVCVLLSGRLNLTENTVRVSVHSTVTIRARLVLVFIWFGVNILLLTLLVPLIKNLWHQPLVPVHIITCIITNSTSLTKIAWQVLPVFLVIGHFENLQFFDVFASTVSCRVVSCCIVLSSQDEWKGRCGRDLCGPEAWQPRRR